MINTNHEHFRRSARTKRDAARDLVKGTRKHSAPAVYLSHVTLECAIKLRILRQSGVTHINDLKRLLPEQIFNALFNGATGHDLHHLAKTASIDRFLEAGGNKSLLKQPEWGAMAGERPYSLRYGTESVGDADAQRQVAFAAKLADLILERTL
jgi:hypothetical protein